ncbi:phage major capsid protein, partial [Streptococcus pyogenes]
MNAPQRKINKIGFGSRILRPATSGVALTQGQRSKPDLSQVLINTDEVIAEVRIPYDVIEDNIERGNV